MAYLMKKGAHYNYYILRIPRADWDSRSKQAKFQRRLQTLTLPPVLICLQLFGFQGGFHPRVAKTTIAGLTALSNEEAILFMRQYHTVSELPGPLRGVRRDSVLSFTQEIQRDPIPMLSNKGKDKDSARTARRPMP